jgi:hypothetical protein
MQPPDYWKFVDAVHAALARLPVPEMRAVRLEVSGSLARGELSPPYSDLDLLLIAPRARGAAVRDQVPAVARAADPGLLGIFVDPLHPEACFCSIYRGPFKVDWWVYEELDLSSRVPVWRGDGPPPYDWTSHSWDWLWWLWGKARRGKDEVVVHELPRLWQFLAINGADSHALPARLPATLATRLQLDLLRRTMHLLPDQDGPLGREIRRAIEQDDTT